MIKAWVLLGALIAAVPLSEAVAQEAGSPVDASYGLQVTATKPVVVPCNGQASGCFRVFFNIESPGSVAGVAFPKTVTLFGDTIVDTTAFGSNGGACQGHGLAGLPATIIDMAGSPVFAGSGMAYLVTPQKPATFLVQFDCDAAMPAGEPVRLQLTLAVLPNGVVPPRVGYERVPAPGQIAHWVWPNMELATNAAPANQQTQPPRLGIVPEDLPPAVAAALQRPGLKGVLATGVFVGSRAQRSGIQTGDVLITFDGRPLKSVADLAAAVQATPEGRRVVIKVVRGAADLEIPVQF